MNQKIALLYLLTGGGHLSGSKALAQVIDSEYGSTDSAILVNGFTEKMPFHNFFFEKGYMIASNYLEPVWTFFYHVSGNRFVSNLMKRLVSRKVVAHLERVFREEGVTKVVALHPILTTTARMAIDRVNPSIGLMTVVMDPFTGHGSWFYERNSDFIIFSDQLKKVAIEKYGVDEKRVHRFPCMVSPKFDRQYTEEEKSAVRKGLGISGGSKVILLAGGGEGLKGADRIVATFIAMKMTETLIVVCGKNKVLFNTLSHLVHLSKRTNILVFGFVSCMPDFMNIADCVVTKGGPGTIFEALSVGKPLILSTFIPGQEYGNMRYVVDQGVGWYIKSPKKILRQAKRLVDEPELAASVRQKIAGLKTRSGINEICRFIHEFPGA